MSAQKSNPGIRPGGADTKKMPDDKRLVRKTGMAGSGSNHHTGSLGNWTAGEERSERYRDADDRG